MSTDTGNIHDPTEYQLRAFDKIGVENVQVDDLSSPQVVQLIIHQRRVILAELKGAKEELAKIHKIKDDLIIEKNELQIKLARSEERQNYSLIEIPISILSGFAINMLAANPQNGLGWFLLVLSLFILLVLRGRSIASLFNNTAKKGPSNGQN